MKLSFGAALWLRDFHYENFYRMLDELSLIGFDGFELDQTFLMDWFENTPWRMTKAHLIRLLEMHGLEISMTYFGLDFKNEDNLSWGIYQAKKRMDFFSEVGCKHVLMDCVLERPILGGEKEYRYSYDRELIKKIAGEANCMAEYAINRGMRLSWHQHWGNIFERQDAFEQLFELTDPKLVGYCCDTAQLAICGFDVAGTIKKYMDRIDYVHLKDVAQNKMKNYVNNGAWDIEAKYRMVELGRGVVDFKQVAAILKEGNFDGWIADDFDYSGYQNYDSALYCKEYINTILDISGEKR